MSAELRPTTPSPLMRVDVGLRSDGLQIVLAGELDLSNVAEVRQQILAAARRCQGSVVVDLSGMTFISVAGVCALAAVAAWCRAHERGFRLVEVPGTPRRVMTLCGFTELLE